MAAGFRIARRTRTVAPGLVTKFATVPVANVSDVMTRMTAGGAQLRPLHTGGGLAGPALTVKTRPGDNLMVHKAIDLAAPGDVIVVDAGGDLTNAIIGELMLAHAIRRGVGGFVIDGAVRDAAAIRAAHLPVFAAGVTHRGPYKDGPGEINLPIAINGMVVAPGDLILGDEDGVLCVPFDDCETVLAAALAKQAAELRQMAATQDGSIDRSWVDASLARLGCELP
ncbi:RraA family protein [Limobrevibacterium gyesilva]|uniref:Putative 4-hydroxy-4-methyl-2-oxoglutarate aldolase n=1 Tax=Limobrevibacterium gyesilva TaxID=2991712 RepID=A0AA41YME4_9PROT|nr:RraA family protein [Limobrevibacterium gyesilva]MCW3474658.1 RraA family protein [Limobrevibacterium gyesilva]